VKIGAWIVDDEPLARRGLRDLLANEPDVEVLGESPDGPRAVEDLQARSPDLVFLDVQMPGLDGFEVLSALGSDRLPIVVFVTAYDLYALRAFDAHVLDYLLKPVEPARLRRAVERAREILRAREAGAVEARLRALLASLHERRHAERLLVRSAAGVTVVPVAEVDWIRADGDYARLRLGSREELLRESLQSLADRLDPRVFIRIHRSHIVRIDRVRAVRILDNGDGTAVLKDGTELPVSRTRREALLRALRSEE
jgi:two-component system LytT family response regulator